MLAILLAAALSGTPSPKPTPQLKVIVNVKSTAFCSAVKSMAVPLGYVTKRNELGFSAMNHSMLKFMENTQGITATTAADLRSLDSSLDDAEMYTPSNDVTVSQMYSIAFAITQNLTLEDQVMNDSWKKYPKGTSPNVDALRQRMQNLMDLQRSLANKYLQFAEVYRDNEGNAKLSTNPALLKAFLRETLLGMSAALMDSKGQVDPEILPQASAHDTARNGNVAQVVKELRLQELAFSTEILTAGDTCGM